MRPRPNNCQSCGAPARGVMASAECAYCGTSMRPATSRREIPPPPVIPRPVATAPMPREAKSGDEPNIFLLVAWLIVLLAIFSPAAIAVFGAFATLTWSLVKSIGLFFVVMFVLMSIGGCGRAKHARRCRVRAGC